MSPWNSPWECRMKSHPYSGEGSNNKHVVKLMEQFD